MNIRELFEEQEESLSLRHEIEKRAKSIPEQIAAAFIEDYRNSYLTGAEVAQIILTRYC